MPAEYDETAIGPFDEGPLTGSTEGSATSRPTLPMPTEADDDAEAVDGDAPATRALPPNELPTPSPTPTGKSGAFWDTIESGGEFQPGQVIFNRYVVQGKLGRGGMGTVWLVTHRELNTDRAIKLIVAGISFDTQARARFRREAQVMARFLHPNAVIVHDARLTEQDVAFIDMEYIQGQSLDRVIQRGHPMPLDWIARVLDQLCDVLQVAHDNGIVHRDLKPANLMLMDGRPYGKEHLKVLDFGIAKILREVEPEGGPSTMTGVFMGTPPYASPEQADGKADTRSDVYAVGVLLYEFLTGFRPFSGPASRVLVETITIPPPPFSAVNPQVSYPPGIEAMVMRCLAKRPEDRPQSTREVAEAFRALLPRPVEATPAKPPEPAPARPKVYLLIAAAAVLLILGSAWAARVLMPPKDPTVEPASTSKLPPNFAADPKAGIDASGLPLAVVPTGPLADLGMKFILLPGGEMQHSPGPNGVEYVPAFAMSETEVTNGQMHAYFREMKIDPPKEFELAFRKLLTNGEAPVSPEDAERHPAVGIKKKMAEDFARWFGGQLPTQTQWAYAARCGGKPMRLFVWPDNKPTIADGGRANLDTLTSVPTSTTKVKSYQDDCTEQGLFDMTGNVREWCRDPGRTAGESVVRGGCFRTIARGYTNFKHEFLDGDEALDDLGFRVVLEWPDSE